MTPVLKTRIEQDLKTALLARDNVSVTALRSLKNAILNEEVAQNARDVGLNDETITKLFLKESKERQESADLYQQGNDIQRRDAELAEKAVIDKYIPRQPTEEEIILTVNQVISELHVDNLQALGQVIGSVKQRLGSSADGAVIARVAKERLGST